MKALGLQNISTVAIKTGDRLRTIDDGYAQLLADNIKAFGGLRQPIEVRRKGKKDGEYLLIAGGHRLRAFDLLGWATIPAFVFDASEEEARLAEIDENLIRHNLNPLDRATFLYERERVYVEMNPEAAHGGDRRSEDFKNGVANLAACFAAETRERTGLSDRTVQRALMIAKKLAPDVRVRLAGTDTAKKQSELEALAKLPQVEQRRVVDLIQEGKAKTVAAAAALAAGTPEVERDEDSQKFDKLVNLWERCGQKIRLKFIDLLRRDDLDDLLAALPPLETENPPVDEWGDDPGEDGLLGGEA